MNTNLIKPWFLYLIECGDGSIYVGISPDPEKRLQTHASGKGSKYTRGRGPLKLIYTELIGSRSDATRREIQTKKLSHKAKLALSMRE